MARHLADDGVLVFSLNPGGIKTELTRHSGTFFQWLISFFLFEPWKGAITQLYAGTSPALTKKDSGKYFIPWAREELPMAGVQDPALADKLWDFLEKDTAGKY
jgi:retinol dehydrogenase 12